MVDILRALGIPPGVTEHEIESTAKYARMKQLQGEYCALITHRFIRMYPFLLRDVGPEEEQLRNNELFTIFSDALKISTAQSMQYYHFKVQRLCEPGARFQLEDPRYVPHRAMKLKEDDDDDSGRDPEKIGILGREFDFMIEPVIIRAGDMSGKNFDREKIMHQGVVWVVFPDQPHQEKMSPQIADNQELPTAKLSPSDRPDTAPPAHSPQKPSLTHDMPGDIKASIQAKHQAREDDMNLSTGFPTPSQRGSDCAISESSELTSLASSSSEKGKGRRRSRVSLSIEKSKAQTMNDVDVDQDSLSPTNSSSDGFEDVNFEMGINWSSYNMMPVMFHRSLQEAAMLDEASKPSSKTVSPTPTDTIERTMPPPTHQKEQPTLHDATNAKRKRLHDESSENNMGGYQDKECSPGKKVVSCQSSDTY